MHHLAGVQREVLPDLDDGAVVERAEHGQVVVLDVGDQRLEQREHDPLGGLAEVVILLRGQADDGGRVDGVAFVGDGADLGDGIAVRHGVEAGVVAEGAFEDRAVAQRPGVGLARVPAGEAGVGAHEAFDHDLGVGGDPERDGLGTAEADALAVEKAGHEQFADAGRQRAGGGIGHHAGAAEGDGDGHGLAEFFPTAPVAGAVVVHVPVHGQAVLAQQLHAVHADIVGFGLGVVAVVGVDGVDAGEGDVAATELGVPAGGVDLRVAQPWHGVVHARRIAHGLEVAVVLPAAEHAQAGQVQGVAGLDDLLATPRALDPLRPDLQQRQELLALGDGLAQRAGRLGLDQVPDP